MQIANVRLFAEQVQAFRRFINESPRTDATEMHLNITLGKCLATIAYAQLIAENAVCLKIHNEMISAIFQLLVADLSAAAFSLACLPRMDEAARGVIRQIVTIPAVSTSDWDSVTARLSGGSTE
jgi:hypothetical protein